MASPNLRSKHLDKRIKLAQKQGRHFHNIAEIYTWPYVEVMQFLKNRSPSISLHDEKHEQILSRDTPSQILFGASETKN